MAFTEYEFLQLAGALGWGYDKGRELFKRHAGQGGIVEAVSAAGALVTHGISELTVSGTKAYTLAAPEFSGQRKIVRCVSAAATPLGTLTVSSPDDTAGFVCSSTFTFTAAGQEIEFEATSALKWRAVRIKRSGNQAVVVGTDVLTGLNLALNYQLSVTGTVSSTGTKALPNGSAVGERVILSNPTAASTPIGNINFTGLNMLGAAATDLQAIGATTDTALLEWNGASWQVMYSAGITVA